MRSSRTQVIAILAVGSLLGFIAASGIPSWLSQASATPSQQPVIMQGNGTAKMLPASSCCSENSVKARLVASNSAVQAPLAVSFNTPAGIGAQDGEETITFEILVPADAALELNGSKMDPTGESRRFVTPALKTGGHYSYDVKATSKGKEVTRKIHLGHGVTNSFDLRGEFGTVTAANPTAVAAKPSAGKKPNILYIMGDDVGWFNIGAYHQGIMSGKTPNLDKLAREGMRFTDYYAEASCTAGRASFITGEIPLRTGLTTVGQAGADVGMPAQACTIATALKAQGYSTGQFGKNHLGDLNKYLPTLHGFDEFFGYLYHLDAMSDPFWYSFPSDPKFYETYGPRQLVHTWATENDDATEMPRWGKVGKQKIVDEGPLRPFKDMTADHQGWQKGPPGSKYDMETFDEVLVESTKGFMDKAKKDGKPFFIWHNTTRMHVFTYLSPKYQSMMNYKSNFGLEEAGMKQMDDSIGAILKHLEDIGEADNTLVVFSTDNGAEVFTWPDGGMTPFKGTKGTVMEGGFRAPCIARWPGKIKPGTVENGVFSGLDWFPTMLAAAGNPNVTDELLKGSKIGERSYKNHLDGYNQLDLLLGKGPSKRNEFFYFGGPHLGAVRIGDFKYQFYQQPGGWPGAKVTTDMPTIVNLRQDPFERTPSIGGQSLNDLGGGYMNDFYAREFWRFVFVQQEVGKLAKTAIDYPPMQDPASFNLDAIKKKIDDVIRAQHGN